MRRSSRQKDAENPILCPACHLKHLNQEALALTEESLKAEREKQHVEQEILRHHRQAQNDLYQAAHEKWRACVSRYKALKKRKERPDDYYAQLAAATAEADAALTEQNRLRDELRQGVLVVDPILGDCVIYRRPGPPRKYPLPAPQVTA
jgi:transketolase